MERGREHFSPTEENVLREYLDDFRVKSKEERKELLMFKIYRLIKAAGPELNAEQWRIRKKVAVASLGCPHRMILTNKVESERVVL